MTERIGRLALDKWVLELQPIVSVAAFGTWLTTALWSVKSGDGLGKVPRAVALRFGATDAELDELSEAGIVILSADRQSFHFREWGRFYRKPPTPRHETQAQIDAFEEFWLHYPKKVAKLEAKTAYLRATRKVTPEDILVGLRRHVVPWRDYEKRFIPNPATWLNGQRWQDEAPQAQPSPQPTRGERARAITERLKLAEQEGNREALGN